MNLLTPAPATTAEVLKRLALAKRICALEVRAAVKAKRDKRDSDEVGIVAIFRKPNQILLAQRKYAPEAGKWALPGGHIHYGESLEAGTRREVMEEIGVSLGQLKEVRTWTTPTGGRVHLFYTNCNCKDGGASIKPLSETSDVMWADFDHLPPNLAWNNATLIPELAVSLGSERVNAAEPKGHPFHGNQWLRQHVAQKLAEQPGNVGKTAQQLEEHWLPSSVYHFRRLPIHIPHPASRVPPGHVSQTQGPIVIDKNIQEVGRFEGPFGVSPEHIVVDGKHRLAEAIARGDTHIDAYVGDQALAKVDKQISQHTEQVKHQEQAVAGYRANPNGTTLRHLRSVLPENRVEEIRKLIRGSDPMFNSAPNFHLSAQDAAAARYRGTVRRFIHVVEGDVARKKRSFDDLLLYWLMLMEDEEASEFGHMTQRLARAQALPFIGGEGLRSAAESFAQERAPLLRPFAETTCTTVKDAFKAGGMTEARRAGEVVLAGAGERVATTEATATYGGSQMRLLKEAGFTHKAWNTMDDDRVRESHRQCEAQGSIPIDDKFHNGLQYPGDPVGGPDETCNCRCWITGQGRMNQ